MITWNLEEAEADFILATLNGQPQNWTVMARATLIQKLMGQAQNKQPDPVEAGMGQTQQKRGETLLDGAGYGGTSQDGRPM